MHLYKVVTVFGAKHCGFGRRRVEEVQKDWRPGIRGGVS